MKSSLSGDNERNNYLKHEATSFFFILIKIQDELERNVAGVIIDSVERSVTSLSQVYINGFESLQSKITHELL